MAEPVTVIVPALNEDQVIGGVIQQIQKTLDAADIPHEILVVDDGSEDRTGLVAQQHGAKVLTHPQNLGYGKSIKDGIMAASYDLVMITDADGTYPIEKMPTLLAKAREFDMVVGARQGTAYRGSLIKWIARRCFKFLSEFATGRTIVDINSGYRVFRRSQILPFFPQISSGFSFTTTSTLAYMLNGRLVHYLTIPYHPRVGKSKVRYFRDTLRAFQIIVEAILTYNPIKVFLMLAMPLFGMAALAVVASAAAGSMLLLVAAALVAGVACLTLAIGCGAVTVRHVIVSEFHAFRLSQEGLTAQALAAGRLKIFNEFEVPGEEAHADNVHQRRMAV